MASAGAGKTTSLVAEYLSICLKDEKSLGQYRHILAVTFTNNATAEMRDRIVKTLNQFAFVDESKWSGSNRPIFNMIVRANPHLDVATVQDRSRRLLAEILYDYPNFSISTIDSFFQRIVRAFAFELGVSMNYEVEVTLDDCFQQTIDLLLGRISNREPKLRDRVLRLVESRMDEKGRWDIEGALHELLNIIYQDENAAKPLSELSQIPENDRNTALAKLAKSRSDAREKVEKVSEGAHGFLESIGLTSKDLVGGAGQGKIYKWFENYAPGAPKCYGAVIEAIEKGESFVKPGVPNGEELNVKIVARYQELVAANDEYAYRCTLLGKMQELTLIFDLKSLMDEIRERDNKFYLSDTNFKINKEIADDDTPFIYEKIGNRYRHFFIDEFQDTSHMQWDNLMPLLRNALSYSDGEVILFGDVKQAIYRFRNGDSKLLNDLSLTPATPEYLKLMPGDAHCRRRTNVPLDVNHRTGGNIVKFNNLFFHHLAELSTKLFGEPDAPTRLGELYGSYYSTVEQKVFTSCEGKGTVCVRFKGEEEDKETYFTEQVLLSVRDALNRGYHLCDIGLLTSGKETGSALGRELIAAGYRVVSAESLLLSTSPEVNLIMSALKYVNQPDDMLARFIIANYVLEKSTVEGRPILAEVVDKLRNHHDFLAVLSQCGVKLDRIKLSRQPIFSMITDLLILFQINQEDAFVIALMDNVLNFISTHGGELDALLTWWEENGDSLAIKSPQGLDAIRISTIHKAKGLEYPVVILPMTQYGWKNTKSDYWYVTKPEDKVDLPYLLLPLNQELERIGCGDVAENESAMSVLDNLNKTYVAHTRPKDYLYIITGQRKPVDNYNGFLTRFIDSHAEGPGLHFVADADDPLRFWWGEDAALAPARAAEGDRETSAMPAVAALSLAHFDLRRLSSHLRRGESPEQAVGNAVHDYLAALSHFPQSPAEADQMPLPGSEPYTDDIRAALRRIAGDPHWQPYFADGLRTLNETAILPTRADIDAASAATQSRPQTTYRPDRVVLLDGETFVIDYKTGHPSEKAKAKYEAQVQRYVELLRQMGYPNVHGDLLYLNEV